MTKQESTNHPEYESSGLSYIAFSSNGRDFYPQTVTELLEWRDQEANKRVVEALEELATKAVGVCVFPEDIDAVIEKYKPEEEV